VDAMLSDRPYRPTRSLDEVAKEVVQCAGKQFDPDVVRAFMAVVQEQGPDFFRNSAALVGTSIDQYGAAEAARYFLKKSMLS
jgi:HD-GYP domain-containing protein (c-di-GMP phosphodiesterase class II)